MFKPPAMKLPSTFRRKLSSGNACRKTAWWNPGLPSAWRTTSGRIHHVSIDSAEGNKRLGYELGHVGNPYELQS